MRVDKRRCAWRDTRPRHVPRSVPNANQTILTKSRTMYAVLFGMAEAFTKMTGKLIMTTHNPWKIQYTSNRLNCVLIASNNASPFLSCALHARKTISHNRETTKTTVHENFLGSKTQRPPANSPWMAE